MLYVVAPTKKKQPRTTKTGYEPYLQHWRTIILLEIVLKKFW